MTHECIQRLTQAGIKLGDAIALRRIAMTLHRWHEGECGDSNDRYSRCLVRGAMSPSKWAIEHGNNPNVWWGGSMWVDVDRRKVYTGRPSVEGMGMVDHVLEHAKRVRISAGEFIYDDNGFPYWEIHWHNETRVGYARTADREKGAHKRLAVIMAQYPDHVAYIQGDPRGAALYVLRRSDIPAGSTIDACYNRGIAVYK
jgi:hypothetical protein